MYCSVEIFVHCSCMHAVPQPISGYLRSCSISDVCSSLHLLFYKFLLYTCTFVHSLGMGMVYTHHSLECLFVLLACLLVLSSILSQCILFHFSSLYTHPTFFVFPCYVLLLFISCLFCINSVSLHATFCFDLKNTKISQLKFF